MKKKHGKTKNKVLKYENKALGKQIIEWELRELGKIYGVESIKSAFTKSFYG